MSTRRQKNQLELAFGEGVTGEARSAAPEGTEADTAAPRLESPAVLGPLMEAIVERDNLRRALAQVRRNRGAPGVDGMTVDALPLYLKDHWPSIRSQLLDGTYRPQPVLRVEIPKVGRPMSAEPVYRNSCAGAWLNWSVCIDRTTVRSSATAAMCGRSSLNSRPDRP